MTSTTLTMHIQDYAESSYQPEEAVAIPNFQMREENFREFKNSCLRSHNQQATELGFDPKMWGLHSI